MGWFGIKTKKDAKRIQEAQRIENNKKKQKELGIKFYQEISNAAAQNKKYNLLYDDAIKVERVSDSLGPIEVIPYTDSDNSIEGVLVEIKEKTAITPRMVVQASFNVEQDKIHVLWGAYGPEENKNISSFDEILASIVKHVRDYKAYG
jgi:hypothetical protein